MNHLSRARNKSAVAETDTVLVAAPEADEQIVVYQVFVSCSSADEVIFEDETAEVWSQEAGAGGGHVAPFTGEPWFACTAGEALTYTTTVADTTVVAVNYAIEKV
jgi:hypothetical protein